ncbi:MAG: TonB-dependent receptor [Bacteroidales bacterium]|nr:TonB-dependent receptor [Bacteroidales bacterium]
MLAVLVAFTHAVVAQSGIKGVVKDAQSGETLIGANVMIKGTNQGTTTDLNGKFKMDKEPGDYTIVISYTGFDQKSMQVKVSDGQYTDLGAISISPSSVELGAVVVIGKGVIDLEEDRQTPIAVSTISVTEIQTKAVGNVEFPEVMKNTPSVYVSNQSGGFGDAQMFLRGFDQRNTAFLLNGQPINGMEDGKMYWSNWAGISDVANAVQVQRGLGSSKLAISSVGGTVNIVTKATDLQKGGFARAMVGNDTYLKGTVAYNTGVNENGWGFSIMMDYWQAENKWAKGTKGQGQNYFVSVGKILGQHKFNFLLLGSPQWHGQNYTKSPELYEKYGLKYNNNWGELDGDFLTIRKNYYHKPIMNLNWDWDISSKASLSTVLYGSFGRGGGTGTLGNGPGYIDNGIDSEPEGAFTVDGLVDWDYIVNEYNPSIEGGISSGYDGTVLRSSVNNHAWYGLVTNFEIEATENLTVNIGADVRMYRGDHFRQLVDLLGLSGRETTLLGNTHVVSKTFDANPWASLSNFASEEDRVDYDYSENLNYQGVFGQAEYATELFSVFVQGAVSNQSYEREDRTNFETIKTSEKVNKIGYNIKGGASYSITENQKVFVNSGYYSRQPFLDNVFPTYGDYTQLADPEVDNENIFGIEAGYNYTIDNFFVNVNLYYTTWENRFLDINGTDPVTQVEYRTLYTDIAENHQGIEVDVRYKPTTTFMVRGYATYGEWKYDGSTPFKKYNTDTNELIDEGDVDFSGTMVGQAPQVTAGIGITADVLPNKLTVDADLNNYAKFYGYVDEEAAIATEDETYQPERLNDFALIDFGATYKIIFGSDILSFRANIYNILNAEYVSQQDQYGILYGAGTTWNFSVKYNF